MSSNIDVFEQNRKDYLKLATAGAACNAVVRFVLHPLDCVKTTVQAEMGKEVEAGLEEGLAPGELGAENVGAGEVADAGWIGTVQGIIKKGGWGELLRGIDVSTVRPRCCRDLSSILGVAGCCWVLLEVALLLLDVVTYVTHLFLAGFEIL